MPIDEKQLLAQEESIRRQARLDRSSLPVFFACGIIDASIGYYQLAKRLDGQRLLLFAIDLKDLEKQEPLLGRGVWLFRRPENLYAVNIYGPDESNETILNDLTIHQGILKRARREELSLVRTGTGILQSRAMSYARQDCPQSRDHHLHAYTNALHSDEYPAVHDMRRKDYYARLRFPQSCLYLADDTPTVTEEMRVVLSHYNERLQQYIAGEDCIEAEKKLSWRRRKLLWCHVHAARLAGNCVEIAREKWEQRYNPRLYLEIGGLLLGIFTKAVPAILERAIKGIPEIFSVGKEAKGLFTLEHKHFSHKPGKRLAPFVKKPKFNTRLNASLYQLDPGKAGFILPQDAAQANLAPSNGQVLDVDPFVSAPYMQPEPGAFRAPLGSITLFYDSSYLKLQANGIWVATLEGEKKLYVGYNPALDLDSRPHPSPLMRGWLQNDTVLRFDLAHAPIRMDAIPARNGPPGTDGNREQSRQRVAGGPKAAA